TGSPVLMNEWIDDVDAVVETWFGGEQLGNATADVLLGDYNPSGKLPVTFPKKWEDCSAFNTYMKKDSVTEYSDGLYVGYRHFDKYNIEPLFHFGYGLSYTTFKYDNLTLSNSTPDAWEAKLTLTNTGKVEGTEIVQLYINDEECSVDRPEKELKGFNKVILKPGETKTVSFKVDKKMLSFYDVNTHDWKFEPGKFNFMIGSSSNDIRLKDNIIFK
ncbi:MAG: fibronectin type III-like domain-contianing protein, partial [Syntrophothermus sp.]